MALRSRVTRILPQVALGVRLHFRNGLALAYSYLFPTIFLVAYWALYRHDPVPIARRLGELLTVTALGGAAFGFPTSFVSERERGVWRRYRLAPVTTFRLLAASVCARYILLLTAAVLQVALAILVFGMPVPPRPIELWLAYTIVACAFMGLGLVIAAMADDVPTVQALGQVIFLPMLILGGIAVPLATLPEWARLLSAYFPGRYAVELIQGTVTGDGIAAVPFSAAALLAIGGAAALAGVKLFRWDAGQRFALGPGARGWVAFALLAWVAVGGVATGGRILERRDDTVAARPAEGIPPLAGEAGRTSLATGEPVPTAGDPAPAGFPRSAGEEGAAPGGEAQSPGTGVAAAGDGAPPADAPAPAAPSAAPVPNGAAPEPGGALAAGPGPGEAADPDGVVAPWRLVSDEELRAPRLFRNLPPDDGIVAPIAPFYAPYPEAECLRRRLPEWEPGRHPDPVQRVRNLLYVAAVPDVQRFDEIEATLPLVVLERLREEFPEEELARLLYWIATHPLEGDVEAVYELDGMCLDIPWVGDILEIRFRTGIYAAKFLARITGAR